MSPRGVRRVEGRGWDSRGGAHTSSSLARLSARVSATVRQLPGDRVERQCSGLAFWRAVHSTVETWLQSSVEVRGCREIRMLYVRRVQAHTEQSGRGHVWSPCVNDGIGSHFNFIFLFKNFISLSNISIST